MRAKMQFLISQRVENTDAEYFEQIKWKELKSC